MTEAEGRAAVVAEAMSWLGTPYHHGARIKGVGVDCAQLVIGVYAGAGVIEAFDPGPYPTDWHLHRSVERYMRIVLGLAHEIGREAVRPGDVILYRFGRAYSHGAIVIDHPTIIHAVRQDGQVTLGDADRDAELIGRETRYFSYWGG